MDAKNKELAKDYAELVVKYINYMKEIRNLREKDNSEDAKIKEEIIQIEETQIALLERINLLRDHFNLPRFSTSDMEKKLAEYGVSNVDAEKAKKEENKTDKLNEEYEKLLSIRDSIKKKINELREQHINSISKINLDGDISLLNQIKIQEKELAKLNAHINEVRNTLKFTNNVKYNNDNVIENTKIAKLDDNIKQNNENEVITEKKNNIDLTKLKIIFDGKNGRYEIKFYENNIEKSKLYPINKELLDKKSNKYIGYSMKYQDDVDYNLVEAMSEFDKEYNTNLKDLYVNNKLINNIIYDLRKFSSLDKRILTNKEKKTFKKNVKKYKERDNVEVIRFSKKKAATLLVLGTVAAASVGTVLNDKKEDTPDNSKEKIESTTQDNLQEKTTEKLTTEDKTTEDKMVIDPEKSEIEVTVDKVKEPKHQVGSRVDLNGADIYYTVFDENPRTNTDIIDAEQYYIDRIIVKQYGSQISEDITKRGKSIEELNKEYGPDAEIWFLIRTNNPKLDKVGWINAEVLLNNIENVKTR